MERRLKTEDGINSHLRVSVREAAAFLGVSEQFVRLGLQRGELPIGSAVKMSSVYTYHISRQLLDEYIGTKKPPCGNRTATTAKAAERT